MNPSFFARAAAFYHRHWVRILALVVLLPIGYGVFLVTRLGEVVEDKKNNPKVSAKVARALEKALEKEAKGRDVAQAVAVAAIVRADSAVQVAVRADAKADSLVAVIKSPPPADDAYPAADPAAVARLETYLRDYVPGRVVLANGDTLK